MAFEPGGKLQIRQVAGCKHQPARSVNEVSSQCRTTTFFFDGPLGYGMLSVEASTAREASRHVRLRDPDARVIVMASARDSQDGLDHHRLLANWVGTHRRQQG